MMFRRLKRAYHQNRDLPARTLPVWALVLAILLASAPLWGPGIVNTRGGGDSPFLLQRTHQMAANLRAGVFPARWMPDAAYGLGYPFFNHYSALPFYLAASLHLLGLDLLTAIKLTQTLGFVIAGLAMYGWAYHLWRSRAAAWLAAVAYTVAPFHLVNVYVRGDSLSEFYAFCFYPLILWALERVARGTAKAPVVRVADAAGLALAYAGLVLSHNISAFIFTPFALLYLLVLVLQDRAPMGAGHGPAASEGGDPGSAPVREPGGGQVGDGPALSEDGERAVREKRAALKAIDNPLVLALAALLVGAGLSAWAWLPALLERGYVQSELLTGGHFDYANHFRTANLVQPTLLFDYSVEVRLGERSPFAMGGLQAVVAAVGLGILLWLAFTEAGRAKFGGRVGLLFPASGLLLSTFMITPLSRPLWDHLPLLATVQFPWRFLSVQALFGALAAGAWGLPLKSRRAWALGGGVALILAGSTLFSLRPERLLIGPEDVTVTRLQEFEWFSGNIGTSVRYEWLPVAVRPRPFISDALIQPGATPRVIPLSGELKYASRTRQGPTDQTWRVQAGAGGAILAFPLLYWPGWQARVDGTSVPVGAAEGSGYLALDVPAGDHIVGLKLGRTALRAAAELLSLASVLALGIGILVYWVLGNWERGRALDRLTPLRLGHGPLGPGPRAGEGPGREAKDPHVSRITFHASRFTHHVSRISHRASSIVCYALFLLAALLFFSVRSSPPRNRADDLVMDGMATVYLHHNPAGIPFGQATATMESAVRLESYTLAEEQLRPAETIEVALHWQVDAQGTGPVEVSLRLVSPAENLSDQVRRGEYTLAESVVPLSPTTVHRLRVPENTPRGLYLLQLSVMGPEGERFAQTLCGVGRGPLYLRPVRVVEGALVPPDAPLLTRAGPDVQVHSARLEASPSGADRAVLYLEWSSQRRLAANYGISVRLLDPNGELRLATDTQPGYGFAPTSLWRPGERIADRYVLALPDDLPPGDGYHLMMVLYRFPSLTEIGRVSLGPFVLPVTSPVAFEPPPRLFELPPLPRTLEADFTTPEGGAQGDHIRLAGYDINRTGESLDLTLWWVAPRQPTVDYTVFLHLFDPAAPAVIVAQSDRMPRGGSYPTSGWLAGEVVSDTLRLSLDQVPPGDYRLALGLYNAATDARLAVTTTEVIHLLDGRLVLPDTVEVSEE